MLQFYGYWYYGNGVRIPSHLTMPPLPNIETLELPKQSILHFISDNPLEYGPTSEEFVFRNITKPIMMEHVVELGDDKGNPRPLSIASTALIRNYHIKHRRFKIMRSFEASARDINTLMVYNYGILPHLFRYMRTVFTDYYRWWNIQTAVWKKVGELANITERHQFVIVNLPTILPGLNDLRLASNSVVSQKIVKLFNTPERLFILELWKWIGLNRQESVISKLPLDKLDRMNIVFQDSGKWFVLNLGVLNRWRAATKEEIEKYPESNTKGLEPKQLQSRVLHMLMNVTASRVGPATADTVAEVPNEIKKDPVTTKTQETVETDTSRASKSNVNDTSKTVTEPTAEIQTTVISNVIAAPADSQQAESLSIPHMHEEIVFDEESQKKIEAELAELDRISENHIGSLDENGEEVDNVVEVKTITLPEDGIALICDKLADIGVLSAAEYKKYNELAKTYKSLLSPDGKTTLDKFVKINKSDIEITDSHTYPDFRTVLDKSMLKSSLHDFDSRYIKNVMQKDIASAVLSVQNAGIAVTNYNVEEVDTVMGSYRDYTVTVKPVEGATSTLRFKVPNVGDDGVFTINNNKYIIRMQRADLPIRKIAPDTVALTSYYGKTFVSRSSKKVNDYGQWLRNAIMAKGLDSEDNDIVEIKPANVFDNLISVPRQYSAISMSFRGFNANARLNKNSYQLNFDYSKRMELYGKEAIEAYEKEGAVLIGENLSSKTRGVGPLGTRIFISLGMNGEVYTCSSGDIVELSSLEELLGLDTSKAPMDFAELKIMGKNFPIGLVLSYELGLRNLLKLLNVTYRRVPVGTRVNAEQHEFPIVFSDETLVISKDNDLVNIIFAGFNEYSKAIKNYSIYEFDKHGVYLNVFETNGIGVRYLRELDLMYQMFIDPITKDLLTEMKEPTNFHGLLKRSCELLLTDHHPEEIDPSHMRIRGYERMAGAVYNELVKTIRAHNGKTGKASKQLDLNPYAVWTTINEDNAKLLVNDINPIENLKQAEAVTFTGVGGRNSRSMTKKTRVFHKNDLGTISEATVDSSDVAVNMFTSADPQFTSLRGITKRTDGKSPTALLSSSALNAPCADTEDMKRVNFISIQNSHSVSCVGYRQPQVRTGYEQVIAQRTGDMYAQTAKKPGKVVSLDDVSVVIEYDDKTVVGYEIGRRYGKSGGLTIPHKVVSDLKIGQKIKEGDVISYNEGFFERDMLNKHNVVMKMGLTARTALMESSFTLEDSCAVSEELSKLLKTSSTNVRNLVISFDQTIHKIVEEGSIVNSEDILCIIEDAVTSTSKLFDKESLDTLRILSAQSPQAKHGGVVEKIEVYYHGDKQDMSDSLRKLVNATDRELARRCKSLGRRVFTGEVDNDYMVDGVPLALDTANIKIYITDVVTAGSGDKVVFANQMKSIIGNVFVDKVMSESGKEIDAIFGNNSIYNRIVLSPYIIGTTTTLLNVIAKKASDLYFG